MTSQAVIRSVALPVIFAFALIGHIIAPQNALCQDTEAATNPTSASAKKPNDWVERPTEVAVTVVPSGMKRNVFGRWTTIGVNGVNPTNQDTEEMVTLWLDDDSSTQFARRLWLPANARRQTWVPALMPNLKPRAKNQVLMTSVRLKLNTEGGEEFQSNVVGEPTSERALLVSHDESRAVVVLSNRSDTDNSRTTDLVEDIYACRDAVVQEDQDLGIVNHTPAFLPPGTNTLDAMDQLIIGGDQLKHDTESSDRIMQWVRDGGRLWVMLDQLDPDYVRQLLGAEAKFSEVDRIELTAYDVRTIDRLTGKAAMSSKWKSDHPVEMARVFADADDVLCQIDGWPAVFWNEVGTGGIMFTTINLHGLIDDGKPLPAFLTGCDDFFIPRGKAQEHASQLNNFVNKEIGYGIPSRGFIATVLGIQLLIVLVVGIWLALTKRLHLLAILVPTAAGIAAAILLFVGKSNTSSVPSTIATGQFAQVNSGGTRANLGATTAMYSQTAQTVNVVASPGTTMMMRRGDSGDDMKRMLWTDDGKSQLVNLQQPPGVVRHIQSQSTISLRNKLIATGTFTSRGFEAEVQGLGAPCEDALVVSDSTPSLALKPATNDSSEPQFVGATTDILPENQYISESMMSDRQRDRQDILRELISPNESLFGRDPRMLVWTDPLDGGLTFGDGFSKRGSALVSLPIKFSKAVSGQEFTVPANFMRLELNAGEAGFSALFNPRTGRWLEDMTKANSASLNCLVPASLLPCQLNSATIQIKLTAPSRTLQITGVSDEGSTILFEQKNPNGLIEFTIDQPQQLQLNSGALTFLIAISPTVEERASGNNEVRQISPDDFANPAPQVITPSDDGSRSVWEIEFFRVSVSGVVQ